MRLKFMSRRQSAAPIEQPSIPSPPPEPPAVSPATRDACFIGRQPIVDRQCNVVAYELLFRSSEVNQAGQIAPYQATAQVILNAVMEIGLDTLVGAKRAFINFSRGFLLLDYVQLLPADRVGIEVLEDTVVGDDLVEALRTLSAQGYSIALDDFRYQENLQPLVELANIIKLDVQALDRPTLIAHVARLRRPGLILLAEKVETYDDFHFCQELGFDYFQGYFLYRPDVVTSQRSRTNRLGLLQLLAQLQDPEVDFRTLEDLIRHDVTLSYKVLRLVNSAYFGLPKTVESIRQALFFLGLKAITTWVTLMLLAQIDDKPRELLATAMVRAKMCEQLAEALAQDKPDTFFLVGLLSVLDAVLDRPLSEVLQALPLADELAQALLTHTGRVGTTLHCVLAYERGNWAAVHDLGCTQDVLVAAYLEALAWATETSNMLAHV